ARWGRVPVAMLLWCRSLRPTETSSVGAVAGAQSRLCRFHSADGVEDVQDVPLGIEPGRQRGVGLPVKSGGDRGAVGRARLPALPVVNVQGPSLPAVGLHLAGMEAARVKEDGGPRRAGDVHLLSRLDLFGPQVHAPVVGLRDDAEAVVRR